MIKIKCDWCNKIIYRTKFRLRNFKHQFCNYKCFGKWVTKFKSGVNSPYFKRKKIKCKYCKKTLLYIPYRIKNVKYNFCNRNCRRKFYIGKKHFGYIHGQSRLPYCIEFKYIKEQVIIRDRYKCQLCGVTQKQHKIKLKRKLSVHHTDYNKSHADPKRLITLCHKCNNRVNKNRDYWFAYFSYILNNIL